MIQPNFKYSNSFNIYHFNGKKVNRGSKLLYVYDKMISIDDIMKPSLIKNNSNLGKESDILDKYYINITYLEDDDRHHLVKLMFQSPLELG